LLFGDKLLGGPQAGILLGKAELIARIKQHPLMRALRVDKMTLAALEATLRHYQRGEAATHIPIWRMIALSQSELSRRAESWAPACASWAYQPECRPAFPPSARLPAGRTLPTTLLSIAQADISTIA